MNEFTPTKTISGKKLALTESMIRKYWNNQDPDIIAPVLKEMDSKESWVVTRDPSVGYALKKFAEILKKETVSDEEIHKNVDYILTVLAYMNSSWAFRLLKWFDEYRNSVLMKLVIKSTLSVNDYNSVMSEYLTPSELFIDRMIALKNLSLISSIFSEERSNKIDSFLKIFEQKEYSEENQ